MMGLTRWSKKFSDRFSLFDTIPAVTDTQPASHPASHVAVAITLNAKASSLKTIRWIEKWLTPFRMVSMSSITMQSSGDRTTRVGCRCENVVFVCFLLAGGNFPKRKISAAEFVPDTSYGWDGNKPTHGAQNFALHPANMHCPHWGLTLV